MNKSLAKLFKVSSQETRTIIGLMSGTSMDGLDIALCSCTGSGLSTKLKLLNFMTINYEDEFRSDIKSIFAKHEVNLQLVCLLNEVIGLKHAKMILSALKDWEITPSTIDLIASHGQTIFHAPKRSHGLNHYPNATLQIGDGDHIAYTTGILTLCDFRQKNLAAGGEGAPLAVYGDYLLFSKPTENRILVNIGGIANLTFIPADGDAHHVFSTDIGPGNTLMDQYVQAHYTGLHYDKDGAITKKGNVSQNLLDTLLDHPFFTAPFPKTTGPELFNLTYLQNAQKQSKTTYLNTEDVLATLCLFSAEAIVSAIKSFVQKHSNNYVYLSGGGIHHPILVEQLKQALPALHFATTESLGIIPEAKEAVLFAVLANECVANASPVNFGTHHGIQSISMGKICLP